MELHTPAQVALILRTSKNQVLTYIREGRLKAKRISPRVIRIPDKALVEFVENAN